MAEVACVPHGPDGFEALIGDARLSEREEWRSSLTQEAPVEAEMPSPVGEQPRKGLGLLFLKCLAASFVIVTLAVVLSIVF